jgi:cyclophilin family peptidyl-prolyl cis-trans isomerase
MKINKKNLFKLLVAFLISNCARAILPDGNDGQTKVMIITDLGIVKIRLYNETPLHRDNFLKLIKEHYYDSLLFHRVIQGFMIQGGDPDSKRASDTASLGNGGPPYTISAEFKSNLFHKRGALAAARESDLENPLQASSASQFYIVEGKIFTEEQLQYQAKRITKMRLYNEIINRNENKKYLNDYLRFTKKNQLDSMKYVTEIINKQLDIELPITAPYKFSEAQIKAYTTIGGSPHLDGSYTVFGEVYEGIEVVEDIAKQAVNSQNRPIQNIRMKIIVIP